MITVVSIPNSPLRSFTPTLFTVASNNPATERIKANFSGTRGNTGGSGVGTIELTAQVSLGSTGAFTYDLQEFVRDNLSYDIIHPAATTDAYPANNSIFRLASQIYLELVDVNGVLVDGNAIFETDVLFFINAIRQVDEPEGIVPYTLDTSVVGLAKFLTDSPRTIHIATGDSYVLSAYCNSIAIDQINVAFRNSSGNIIGLQTKLFTTPMVGRYDVPVGLANLATAGITPPSGTYDYVVWLSDGGTPHTEGFIFRIDNGCYEDPLRVHFLNKLGGFDSYTFKGLVKREVTTTSSQYEKNIGVNYNQQTRGRQTQYRNGLASYVATSEILSSTESIWLEELVTSAVVYVELGGLLYSATINDGKFLIEDRLKLKQLQLTLTSANDKRNQRL